jgi:hypothetical protein
MQRLRAPLWFQILLDNQRPHALPKIPRISLGDVVGQQVFELQALPQRQLLAHGQQPVADFQTCRRHLVQTPHRLHGPLAPIEMQVVNDLLDRVAIEALVNRRQHPIEVAVQVIRHGRELGDGFRDLGVTLAPGQRLHQLLHALALDKVRRQSELLGVVAVETGAGQGDVEAEIVLEPWQHEAGARVGEEPDFRLGHGEDGALGRDAVLGGHRVEAGAAHADAVDEGDVGLVDVLNEVHGVGREVIELVDLVEGHVEDLLEVESGTEGLARALDDDVGFARDGEVLDEVVELPVGEILK